MLKHSVPTSSALALTLAMAGALLVGCASPTRDETPRRPGAADPFQHVHGLALDEGDVIVATHGGIYRVSPTGATRGPTGGLDIDTMGFTRSGDTTYASGHPGPETSPALGTSSLGLIRSTDLGRSWDTVSLRDRADFHALAARPVEGDQDRVVGLAAGRSRIMRSADGGSTWSDGAELTARDLLYAGTTLLATTEDGLAISTDDGRSFTIDTAAPRLYLLASGPEDQPLGVDTDGTIWSMTAPETWTRGGSTSGTTEAITSDGLTTVVVDARGISETTDLGTTWTTRRPRS